MNFVTAKSYEGITEEQLCASENYTGTMCCGNICARARECEAVQAKEVRPLGAIPRCSFHSTAWQ